MTDLTEMWDALAEYQPYADKHGFGVEWRRMCEERTEDAAWDAAECWTITDFAGEAAVGAARAWRYRQTGRLWSAALWMRHSIEYVRRAIEGEQT